MSERRDQRSRILVVAPELPHPPFTGAHTRPLSVIRALARRFDVVVAGAAPAGADLSAIEEAGARVRRLEMSPYARSAVGSAVARARQLVTPVPLLSRSHFETMGRFVEDAVADIAPSVMHLVSMYSCWYRDERVPAVIDLLDVVSGLCEAAAAAHPARYGLARIQSKTSERVERRELARMAAVIAINREDAARVHRLGIEPAVVPLAVSVPSAAEIGGGPGGPGRASEVEGAAATRILFVGNFLHHPNRAAAAFLSEELAPRLKAGGTPFTLTIAGRSAHRAHAGSSGPSVEYLEDVPDLAPLYRAADIVVVPVAFGGGTKNKTLEAMAWGKPVIGTPQAFSGVEARDGEAFASTPLDAAVMAALVARLAADPSRRANLGAAGRDYVRRNHTQEIVDERVQELYRRVLESPR
jgi:glycosyltransferase involved in cell wall biosynthesis